VIFATRAGRASRKKLRSFSQFVFFAHRFRLSGKIIFHPAGHPFSCRFADDEWPRDRAIENATPAMLKSIVVQNAAYALRGVMRTKGLQAAS